MKIVGELLYFAWVLAAFAAAAVVVALATMPAP